MLANVANYEIGLEGGCYRQFVSYAIRYYWIYLLTYSNPNSCSRYG